MALENIQFSWVKDFSGENAVHIGNQSISSKHMYLKHIFAKFA